MRIGRTLALLMGIGLLAGCPAQMKQYPADAKPTSCKEATCEVKVTVTVIVLPKFSCTVTVDPVILDVSGGPAVQTIKWTVAGANWPPLGDKSLPIVFDGNAKDVISKLAISANSVSVTYTRPKSGGNHYGYGINTLALPGQFCGIDPFVQD